ncbi:MAG: polysaccharide deacetylase family protein [Luteolibacter sp.]
MNTNALLAAVWAVCLANPVAHAAPFLSLNQMGVQIDNGAGNNITLDWPLLVNAAKAKINITEKTVIGNSATLKYDGGGQMDLAVSDGKITLLTSALPENIKSIHAILSLGTDFAAGGKWQAGTEGSAFTAEYAVNETLHSGQATPLVLTAAAGVVTAIGLPPNTYEQLQDLRKWNIKGFGWQFWTNLMPGTSAYVITVGDTVPVAATVAATRSAPVASASSPIEITSGGTRVRQWKDGKVGVFMMAFDDSAPTHLKLVIPELEKRKMVGTFYINPGNGPYKNQRAEWEKAAASPSVELGNHTWTHVGAPTMAVLDAEMEKCNEVILKAHPERKQPRLIAFGQPGGVPWQVTREEFQQGLDRYHLVDRPPFSGPPFHQKSLAQMLAVVDDALARGQMTHLDFHGVGGDWHVTSMEWFTGLLDKLDAERERIWVTDPVSLHKYVTERKGAQLKELVSNDDGVRVSLSSSADPTLYDLPLTLSTKVPPAWTACVVSQGKSVTPPLPVTGGEVRYDAIPGPDEIQIRQAPGSH